MKIHILILGLALFVFGQSLYAQETNNSKSGENITKLLDYFTHVNSEERSARIDFLIQEVNKEKNSKGILILFCGKACQYGEVEAHIRGIKQKLNFRNVDKNNYQIMFGGYREETSVELWIVPENSCLPIPKSTINIEDVKFKGIFKRKIVYYECC